MLIPAATQKPVRRVVGLGSTYEIKGASHHKDSPKLCPSILALCGFDHGLGPEHDALIYPQHALDI